MSNALDKIDLDQPVIGYRVWSLKENGILGAITGRGTWHPGINYAMCLNSEKTIVLEPKICFHSKRAIPDAGCTCGLHAYRTLSMPLSLRSPIIRVVGAVLLYGRMFAGNSVIRAEKAEILALTTVIYPPFSLRPINASYGVPVVESPEDLETIALEHGEPLKIGKV